MIIYTSYFRLNGNHPQAKSIVHNTPEFFKGKVINMLAPDSIIVDGVKKGLIKQKTLLLIYENYIKNKLDLNNLLMQLSDGDVLLAHHKDYDNCHRKIISEFLKSNGIDCIELGCELIPVGKKVTYGQQTIQSNGRIS